MSLKLRVGAMRPATGNTDRTWSPYLPIHRYTMHKVQQELFGLRHPFINLPVVPDISHMYADY
jgi:hypothetical protein